MIKNPSDDFGTYTIRSWLYLSFMRRLGAASLKSEVTTISQAASLIGSTAIEVEIKLHDHLLEDEDSVKMWCVLSSRQRLPADK